MKNNTVLLLFIATLILSGCRYLMDEQHVGGLTHYTDGDVIIQWDGNPETGVQSFQANVLVYVMNNRHDIAPVFDHDYRLSVSTINNKLISRIDFNNDFPFRSVISDSEEAIVFDPETEEIGYRIPLEKPESPLYRVFGQQSILSRLNLSLIRDEARRLSLNMHEETDGEASKLLIELPPDLLPQNAPDTIISSRAVFDILHEVVLETEVVMIREDGTNVTTTATPQYMDIEGVPVKVGMVTVIDSKAPGLIEGFDPDMQYFNSPDDIPTISQEQYDTLMAEGNAYEIPFMTFGNPADLSFVETVYEVYHDIAINSAPERLFRIMHQQGGRP